MEFSSLILQWKNQDRAVMVGFDAFTVILGKLKTMLRKKILEDICISVVSVVFLMNTHLLIWQVSSIYLHYCQVSLNWGPCIKAPEQCTEQSLNKC